MNKRQKQKREKIRLNTPTKYLATGGFLTPYACPSCLTHFKQSQAYTFSVCPICTQKLIFWDVFEKSQI